MMAMQLPYIVNRTSTKGPIRLTLTATYRAVMTEAVNCTWAICLIAISYMSPAYGSFLINKSADFWVFLISKRVLFPECHCICFFKPPAGTHFLALSVVLISQLLGRLWDDPWSLTSCASSTPSPHTLLCSLFSP